MIGSILEQIEELLLDLKVDAGTEKIISVIRNIHTPENCSQLYGDWAYGRKDYEGFTMSILLYKKE